MPKKTWSCFVSTLLATFSSVAFGFHTTSVKAEPEAQTKVPSTTSPVRDVEAQSQDSSAASSVLKVGETRSQSIVRSQSDAIARIYPHVVRGRSAATVYVRNIPVFTFLGSRSSEGGRSKALSSTKLPSNASTAAAESKNPVERATALAASINQFSRDGLNASTIIPVWESGQYVIKFGDKASVKFDRSVVFSDTLADRTEDILGATNLLRRLMGDAPPMTDIASTSPRSRLVGATVVSRAVQVFSGMASWYGPGLSGNYSASGEPFNQYDLTAAHRSLPFGTAVRVTNIDNGRSVVVRINDRGPFAHGRVIDLSTAAAQVIGLVSAGVAPVQLEVLTRP